MYAHILCVFSCALVHSEGYENLAYLKPTWQSSTHDSAYSDSTNAVDGLKTDFSYIGKQCSVSRDGESTATWWVNLEGIRGINSIAIYYRTDNFAWNSGNGYTARFLGFYVYISNTTNRLDGYLCFHDTTYTRATIPAVANISCPTHGQYVIYYNERLQGFNYPSGYSQYAFTELCEVEVFGCSDPTRYGSDCSHQCSSHCLQYCHIESGQCPQCGPGYKGNRCEQ
ncbi:uncharacterized protein LOC134233449, partial [Saccostrea cucullata]|uniref:uncharacterized protein LOC134233449 n=1 Tax=Saccostrea cuccullata TaxID=36930 RepID=UPI002ED1BDE2